MKLVSVTLVMALLMPIAAMAETSCGTHIGAGKSMFTAPNNHDMVASCRTNGVCILTAGARDQANRVSDILFIGVDRKTKAWGISYSSSDHKIDLSKGISVQIEDGDPMHIPPRFLSALSDARVVRFESKLAMLLRNALMPKKKSTWAYTTNGGKRVKTTFSHDGLIEGIFWIHCEINPQLR